MSPSVAASEGVYFSSTWVRTRAQRRSLSTRQPQRTTQLINLDNSYTNYLNDGQAIDIAMAAAIHDYNSKAYHSLLLSSEVAGITPLRLEHLTGRLPPITTLATCSIWRCIALITRWC